MSKRLFKDFLVGLSGVKVINLQLEHVYGEFDSKEKFISTLIFRMSNDHKIIEFTKGDQKRDFIYVDDVVDAYMCVLNNSNTIDQFSDFEIGTGISVSIKDFVMEIHSLLKSKSILQFGVIPSRNNEIDESYARNRGIREFGWKPKFDILSSLKKIMKEEYNENI